MACGYIRLDDRTFSEWEERRVPQALVFVGARSCAQAVAFEPLFEALGEEQSDQAQLVMVDRDESPELAKRLDVEAVPTLLVFEGGKRVNELRPTCG